MGTALVRIGIVLAMVAVGGAMYGYQIAKDYYSKQEKEKKNGEDRKTS